jgi:peroxiredoxin
VNCHRNYLWYRGWHESFADKGLTVIGVHTPETNTESVVENVRKEVSKAQFQFPVVIDNDKKIWSTWGNTMWPTVYLIDKQGFIRYWWYGELNWQGAAGEKIMRRRIEELLAEE